MKQKFSPLLFTLALGLWTGGCESDFLGGGRPTGRPPEKVIWPKNTPKIPTSRPKKTKVAPTLPVVPRELPDTPASGGAYLIKNAAVEELDVLVMESYPQQIMAVVTGTLPDKATKLDEVEQTRDGDTINLTLTTRRERSAQASMTLIPFKKNIPVNTDGLAEGTYQLNVNGVRKGFSFSGKGRAKMTPTLNSNPSSLPPPVELPPPAPPVETVIPPVLESPVSVPEATAVEKIEKPVLPAAPVPAPAAPRRDLAPVPPGVNLPN